MALDHVTTWIFDLDNTLYSPEMRLFDQIERRMTAYVMRVLGVDRDRASLLREQYWRSHGTTLSGLMAEHGIDPMPYLDEVHDIDLSHLAPDPRLAALIAALPGRRIVHTNGDAAYARRVLAQRGLDLFDEIHGIDTTGFHPKPDPRAYAAVRAQSGFDPARAAMFEDDPRNLVIPHQLGMATILVGPWPEAPDPHHPGAQLPAHVHHQTADLAAFLDGLARERQISPARSAADAGPAPAAAKAPAAR